MPPLIGGGPGAGHLLDAVSCHNATCQHVQTQESRY